MSSRPNHLYEFGPFVLDPAERTLLREGQRVRLRPKVFDMLLVLVENGGRLVEKEELMRAVWPEQFVEEGNLNKNVSLLRDALGESPATPTYIETEPKRGYRFVAEVRAVNGDDEAELVAQTRTRSSLVVEEETDDEISAVGGGARIGDAVVTGPPLSTPSLTSAQPAGKSKRQLNRSGALVAAAATILVVAFAYFYFSKSILPAASGEPIESVAVLPFVNVTNDPNTEYLSDGISESIMNSLSRIPELRVMSRNSVLPYNSEQVDAQAVGKALNVRAVLMGRLTQHGDDLTISTELVDVQDNRRLWGQRYNRKESELLAIQEEISSEIAQALRLHLTQVEQRQLAQRETVNPKAYELLLLGRHYHNKAGTEDRKKAVELFQQAIAVDPKYALAYAELSLAYSDLINNLVADPKEFMPRRVDAALKALELDEDVAEGHLAMARVREDAWDWAEAEREFKRAIGLNTNLSRAHRAYAFFLMIQGRGEQAFAEANRARGLDPISTGSNTAVVYALILAHNLDHALEAAKRMLDLDQSNPDVYTVLGQTYQFRRQPAESLAAYQEAIRLGDHSPDAQIMLGASYAKVGQPQQTRAILTQLEHGKDYVSPVGFAILHVALGESERAFALLEQAYAAHDQQLIWLGVESLDEGKFASVSGDPRFADLLRRMNLKAPPV